MFVLQRLSKVWKFPIERVRDSMSGITELLTGLLRYFPNTMIASLFVLGITTGRIAWVLVAIGGILITVLTLTMQYVFLKTLGIGPLYDGPGAVIVEACSNLPVAGGEYSAVPSLWTAISSFFATYIFMNAANLYTQSPAKINRDKIGVQQRKGMGLISMFATSLLFIFLLVPRYWTSCETIMGLITGLALGIGGGVTWWYILDACGSDVYPDIHGVMVGLKPGALKTAPKACQPRLT